eukprot:1132484-Rhodomonas_salina.1
MVMSTPPCTCGCKGAGTGALEPAEMSRSLQEGSGNEEMQRQLRLVKTLIPWASSRGCYADNPLMEKLKDIENDISTWMISRHSETRE